MTLTFTRRRTERQVREPAWGVASASQRKYDVQTVPLYVDETAYLRSNPAGLTMKPVTLKRLAPESEASSHTGVLSALCTENATATPRLTQLERPVLMTGLTRQQDVCAGILNVFCSSAWHCAGWQHTGDMIIAPGWPLSCPFAGQLKTQELSSAARLACGVQQHDFTPHAALRCHCHNRCKPMEPCVRVLRVHHEHGIEMPAT